MTVIKPQTKITSIREHGLKVLNTLANNHGVSNVHFLTCAILHINTLTVEEQFAMLQDGHSLDLMIRMGCELDDDGNLDFTHIPIRNRILAKEL